MSGARFPLEGFTPEQQKILRAIRRDYLRLMAQEAKLFFDEIDRKEDDSTALWTALTVLLAQKGVVTREEVQAAIEEARARTEARRLHEREKRVSEIERGLDEIQRRLRLEEEGEQE